ncbi:hypothetical protein ACFHW0_28350 [Micromonospora sp. LOL_025]|uniref:hypothetical protein n=1 Tax=Micromonospora sp. LOL_025 TaxID=3345413 RepID=UPI003A87689B
MDDVLRAECAERLTEIEALIPVPWEAEEFLRRLGQARGRTIVIRTVETDPGAPCGLYLAVGAVDTLVVPARTNPYHRDHVLAHEIAHMLFDLEPSPDEHASDEGSVIDPEYARSLFPDIPPELVKALLGRRGYGNRVERRAEIFAELLLERVRERQSTAEQEQGNRLTRDQQAIADRLSRTLEHH